MPMLLDGKLLAHRRRLPKPFAYGNRRIARRIHWSAICKRMKSWRLCCWMRHRGWTMRHAKPSKSNSLQAILTKQLSATDWTISPLSCRNYSKATEASAGGQGWTAAHTWRLKWLIFWPVCKTLPHFLPHSQRWKTVLSATLTSK